MDQVRVVVNALGPQGDPWSGSMVHKVVHGPGSMFVYIMVMVMQSTSIFCHKAK